MRPVLKDHNTGSLFKLLRIGSGNSRINLCILKRWKKMRFRYATGLSRAAFVQITNAGFYFLETQIVFLRDVHVESNGNSSCEFLKTTFFFSGNCADFSSQGLWGVASWRWYRDCLGLNWNSSKRRALGPQIESGGRDLSRKKTFHKIPLFRPRYFL